VSHIRVAVSRKSPLTYVPLNSAIRFKSRTLMGEPVMADFLTNANAGVPLPQSRHAQQKSLWPFHRQWLAALAIRAYLVFGWCRHLSVT